MHLIDGILNLTVGIVNGTNPIDAEYLSECREEVDNQLYNGVEDILEYVDQEEWFPLVYRILEVLGSTHDIATTCVNGFEDIILKYARWASYSYHSGEVLFNAAVASGDIAQDIIGIVVYAMGLPYKGPNTPREIGYLVGDIIAKFLNNPKFKDGIVPHKTTDVTKG